MNTESNFSFPAQITTGSQKRAAKREGSIKTLSRQEAQKMLVSTNDGSIIAGFLSHNNHHIVRYATHKGMNGLGAGLTALCRTEPDFTAYNVKAWTPEQAKAVLTLMAERNMTAREVAERIGCQPRRITDWAKKLAS
jgi:predicted GIY-YIG superfamily endonuclease